jgi:hypothetical protein
LAGTKGQVLASAAVLSVFTDRSTESSISPRASRPSVSTIVNSTGIFARVRSASPHFQYLRGTHKALDCTGTKASPGILGLREQISRTLCAHRGQQCQGSVHTPFDRRFRSRKSVCSAWVENGQRGASFGVHGFDQLDSFSSDLKVPSVQLNGAS